MNDGNDEMCPSLLDTLGFLKFPDTKVLTDTISESSDFEAPEVASEAASEVASEDVKVASEAPENIISIATVEPEDLTSDESTIPTELSDEIEQLSSPSTTPKQVPDDISSLSSVSQSGFSKAYSKFISLFHPPVSNNCLYVFNFFIY